MTGYFNIQDFQDTITGINDLQLQSSIKAIDMPVAFPQWFAMGVDSNGLPQLQCKKYNEQPLILTINGTNGTYTAPSIRLFGPRHHKPHRVI